MMILTTAFCESSEWKEKKTKKYKWFSTKRAASAALFSSQKPASPSGTAEEAEEEAK